MKNYLNDASTEYLAEKIFQNSLFTLILPLILHVSFKYQPKMNNIKDETKQLWHVRGSMKKYEDLCHSYGI